MHVRVVVRCENTITKLTTMWDVKSESDSFTYIPDDTVLDDIGRCSIPDKTH